MSTPSSARRLGPYELVTVVGRGGMGEVWRAHDPRLNRFVAIKLSHEQFNDRFQREARAVAALNHPNICHLYDVGPNYLVMEFVEGAELKGPMPEDEALRVAGQIADALEAAHEKGIVHRDLKPANIRITPDGVVKVLDFGLARMAVAEEADPSESPTTLASPTRVGTILGTAAYMAPEQARGKVVDKRADIWAFGVVLYEILTGKRLFGGETLTDVLADVLKSAPDLSLVPAKMRPLISKCLEKNPRSRLRDIADWRLLLVPASEAESLAQPERPPHKTPWIVAGILAVALGALGFVHLRETPAPLPDPVRFQIRLPDGVVFEPSTTLVMSPDGKHILFAGSRGPDAHLYLQDLNGGPARELSTTKVGRQAPPPFWSPDSRYVVYSENSPKLVKVDITSGDVQAICDKPGPPIGGSWNQDGTIIFGSTAAGLWRVAANGGTAAKLTELDTKGGERSDQLPQFLPDGKHLLYLATFTDASKSGIYARSLGDPPAAKGQRIVAAQSSGIFVPGGPGESGRLLFVQSENLMSQTFDAAKLELRGQAQPLPAKVATAFQTPLFTASRDVIAFRAGVGADNRFQFMWFDVKTGKFTTPVGEPGGITESVLSPDETRVAYAKDDESMISNVWILDLARGVSTRLTSGSTNSRAPVWSPDGQEIAFSRGIDNVAQIFRRKADGSGAEQRVLKSRYNEIPLSWSRDGRYMLFEALQRDGRSSTDIGVVRMDQPDATPFWFTAPGGAAESGAAFSPDGKFVSYLSAETGRNEVYIRAFSPDASVQSGAKWLISNNGALQASWSPDGRKLYWVVTGAVIWSADIDTSHGFHAGLPAKFYEGSPALGDAALMTRKGMALLKVPIEHSAGEPMNVLVNWRSVVSK